MTNTNNGEHIVEQLKQSVKSIIQKTGSNKFAHELIDKIQNLQMQLEELSNSDKGQFIHEMKDSFRATIDKIEQKLAQHAKFERVYNYSIIAAFIFLIIFIFGEFCLYIIYILRRFLFMHKPFNYLFLIDRFFLLLFFYYFKLIV